jgi:hypothetical protein
LIVVADSVKAGLGDNPTLAAILTAAGWETPTQGSNNITEITASATIDGVGISYTINLRDTAANDLEADNFLVLTEDETRDYIADFADDNNIAPNIDIL